MPFEAWFQCGLGQHHAGLPWIITCPLWGSVSDLSNKEVELGGAVMVQYQ